MTVKELISALSKCPKDSEVAVDVIGKETSWQIIYISQVIAGDGVCEPYTSITIEE